MNERSVGIRDLQDIALLAADYILPNAYKIVNIDLTVARADQPLGIAGRGIRILKEPGWTWYVRFSGTDNDLIENIYLPKIPDIVFTELYVTNNPAPTGTEPVTLFVSRRSPVQFPYQFIYWEDIYNRPSSLPTTIEAKTESPPPPDPSYAGQFYLWKQPDGRMALYMCMRTSTGTYVWAQVAEAY